MLFQMEYTYRAKSEALQERERSAMERLQKEREVCIHRLDT